MPRSQLQIWSNFNNHNQVISLYKTNEKRQQKAWAVWNTDYLQSLREQPYKTHSQGRIISHKTPQRGHVVLIKDDRLKRGEWLTGIIESIMKSSDNHDRSARVRLSSEITITRSLGHADTYLLPMSILAGAIPHWLVLSFQSEKAHNGAYNKFVIQLPAYTLHSH
jgi:hypothetical protein